MNDERRPRHGARVVYRELASGDGALLLHLDTGAYHGVNATGAAIWALIDGESSVGEIADRIRLSHVDAPADVREEVRTFVDDLVTRGLLEW